MRRDTEWAAKGICTESDADALFVPGAAQRENKKLCRGCPVIQECLADALDNRTAYGIWGGTTERERRIILKKNPDVTSWKQYLEQLAPA